MLMKIQFQSSILQGSKIFTDRQETSHPHGAYFFKVFQDFIYKFFNCPLMRHFMNRTMFMSVILGLTKSGITLSQQLRLKKGQNL